jgi:Flp pilus assembly protein TadD
MYMNFALTPMLAVTMGCYSLGAALGEVTYGPKAHPTPQARAYAHYIAAVVQERRGNVDEALGEMEAVAKADPEAVTPAMRLVRVHLRGQQFDKALEYMEQVVQSRPDEARYWILLGEIYSQLGRARDAEMALRRAIELDPDNVVSYDFLARLEESSNDLVATAELYVKLTQLDPKSPRFFYKLGYTHARLREHAEAKAALERALELRPNLAEARLLLGIVCLQDKDPEQAILHLRRYLIRRQDDVRARENLAVALAQVSAYAEAVKELAELEGGRHGTPLQRLQLMYCLIRLGKHKEAERYLPSGGAPYMGTFLRAIARREQNEPVAPLLESFELIDGDLDAECNEFLSQMLFAFGREELGPFLLDAVSEFRAQADSRPLGILHGRILMGTRDFAAAATVLQEVEQKYGADTNLHYYLASCHEDLDQFEETERRLRAYLVIEQDDQDVLNFLAYLYAEHAVNLDEAERLVKRALEFEPESPHYLDTLGWVYYQQGKAELAVEYIQRALFNMEGDDAILRDHLGDAYLLQGDLQRAIIEWEKARRLDPELEGVQEKLDKNRKPGIEV